MEITLCKVPGWDSSFVEVDGIKRGIVRPDNSGGWVAEWMGCYKTTNPAGLIGTYATKDRAVNAVVAASAGQPRHIVYPERDEQTRRNWAALGVSS